MQLLSWNKFNCRFCLSSPSQMSSRALPQTHTSCLERQRLRTSVHKLRRVQQSNSERQSPLSQTAKQSQQVPYCEHTAVDRHCIVLHCSPPDLGWFFSSAILSDCSPDKAVRSTAARFCILLPAWVAEHYAFMDLHTRRLILLSAAVLMKLEAAQQHQHHNYDYSSC